MQGMASGSGAPNNIGMAMQMHAWAQVQSAYFVAQSRPRMVASCRQRLMEECKDWRFACEAVWAKPVGKDVKKGLGIRFAEAAAQCWTNLKVESTNICETEDLRILRTTVTDLESNVSHTRDTPVEKFVIRKKPPKLPDGQKAQIWGYNNYGEAQYRVRATADDMIMSQNKELSKAERVLILKHIPKHIQDDCKRALNETLQNKSSRGDRKFVLGLLDQFAEIKISARQLEAYLGHDPEVLTGLEITMLNGLLYDLIDNRTTFADALAARHGNRPDEVEALPPAAAVKPAPERPRRGRPPASAPPAQQADEDERDHPPEQEDRQWKNPPASRRAPAPPPPPERTESHGPTDEEASLDSMDLESLEGLVDEDGQPLRMHPPEETYPEEQEYQQQAPVSRTQRVLQSLPNRSNRGR